MKKLLALLAILALVAAACGEDTSDADAAAAAEAEAAAEAAARAEAEAEAADAQAAAEAAAADAEAAAAEAAEAQAALDEAMAELEATKMAAEEGDEAAMEALAEAEAAAAEAEEAAAEAEAMVAEAEEAAAMAEKELEEAAMAAEIPRGGTLIIAQTADPNQMHPNRYGSTAGRNVVTNMYETLVEFNLNTYEIRPLLATHWNVSEDGLTHEFHIRPDVVFHDGSDLDAVDVVRSIERAQEPGAGRTASLLTRVAEVVATGDLTVEVRLSEPDRILHSTLIDVYISPAEDIDLNATPTGTGPYRFVSWEKNQKVVIERNPDYWGDAYLDRIEYVTVPDENVQSLQIRSGEVHMLAQGPLPELAALSDAGIVIASPPQGNTGLYHFHVNTRRDIWSNPLVRQAVSMAIDRPALQRTLLGHMQVISNPMENNAQFFNPDAASYNTPDVEGAKAVLASAGYADGFDGGEMIVCATNIEHTWLAEAVQEQLKTGLNIQIDLNIMDVATYVDRTLPTHTNDPDQLGLYDLALCAMVPKPDEYDLLNHPYNKLFVETMGWIDHKPEFFELLSSARSIASNIEYKEAIHQLQLWAMEEQPQIVLGGRLNPIPHSPDVKGFISHTQGTLYLTNVYLTDGG
ncbi:MAG: ABC transporter substrate-binding protein [Acidimicrobiia bacterium]|nr:ABC transporter substrate-binding protein [Acidimicrobiia bacterium]MYH05445.1 ABC transporter substrate-binding protein [Acidimicrobiia bacterium]